MSKTRIGLLLAVALLAALSAMPASAEDVTAPQETVPAVAAALPPATAGCEPSLDFLADTTHGEVCPAAPAPANSAPEFLAIRRTCRCSCGFPCQTNADCGPGGICSPGITCC